MKKILTLIALTAALSTSAFAVSGDSARNLRSALKSAGAQGRNSTDAGILIVTKLNCKTENTMGLRSGKCSFIEDGRLVETTELKKVESLVSALSLAGVKIPKKSLGESSSQSISLKLISCNQDFRNQVSCSIK